MIDKNLCIEKQVKFIYFADIWPNGLKTAETKLYRSNTYIILLSRISLFGAPVSHKKDSVCLQQN